MSEKKRREAWERREGESPRAFAAFSIYLDAYGSISLREVYQRLVNRGKSKSEQRQVKSAPNTLTDWRNKHDWDNRVIAYLQDKRDKRDRAKLQKEEELEDEAWQLHKQLKVKAQQMLNFPLVEQEVIKEETDDNGQVVTRIVRISPAKWSQNTTIKMLELAHELGKLAVARKGEDTDEESKIICITGMPMDEL